MFRPRDVRCAYRHGVQGDKSGWPARFVCIWRQCLWHEEARANTRPNKNGKQNTSRRATRSVARAKRKRNGGPGRRLTNRTRVGRRAAAAGAREVANRAREKAGERAAGKRRADDFVRLGTRVA